MSGSLFPQLEGIQANQQARLTNSVPRDCDAVHNRLRKTKSIVDGEPSSHESIGEPRKASLLRCSFGLWSIAKTQTDFRRSVMAFV